MDTKRTLFVFRVYRGSGEIAEHIRWFATGAEARAYAMGMLEAGDPMTDNYSYWSCTLHLDATTNPTGRTSGGDR